MVKLISTKKELFDEIDKYITSKESLDLGVASAAYVNGMAGEIAQSEYGDIGMVSSDTARCVSKAIKELQK